MVKPHHIPFLCIWYPPCQPLAPGNYQLSMVRPAAFNDPSKASRWVWFIGFTTLSIRHHVVCFSDKICRFRKIGIVISTQWSGWSIIFPQLFRHFWDTPVQFPSFIVSVNNLSTSLLRRLWARQASSPAEKSFQVKPSNEDTSGGVGNGDGIYIYTQLYMYTILTILYYAVYVFIYTHIQTV